MLLGVAINKDGEQWLSQIDRWIPGSSRCVHLLKQWNLSLGYRHNWSHHPVELKIIRSHPMTQLSSAQANRQAGQAWDGSDQLLISQVLDPGADSTVPPGMWFCAWLLS